MSADQAGASAPAPPHPKGLLYTYCASLYFMFAKVQKPELAPHGFSTQRMADTAACSSEVADNFTTRNLLTLKHGSGAAVVAHFRHYFAMVRAAVPGRAYLGNLVKQLDQWLAVEESWPDDADEDDDDDDGGAGVRIMLAAQEAEHEAAFRSEVKRRMAMDHDAIGVAVVSQFRDYLGCHLEALPEKRAYLGELIAQLDGWLGGEVNCPTLGATA